MANSPLAIAYVNEQARKSAQGRAACRRGRPGQGQRGGHRGGERGWGLAGRAMPSDLGHTGDESVPRGLRAYGEYVAAGGLFADCQVTPRKYERAANETLAPCAYAREAVEKW